MDIETRMLWAKSYFAAFAIVSVFLLVFLSDRKTDSLIKQLSEVGK